MSELNEFSRAELLLGKEGIEKLRKARVAVFGIGGVGSFAAEALARGGVGHLALVDGDVVSLTNINRQLIATQKTIGRRKTSVMAERIHEILPETEVVEYPVVYGAENRDLLDFAACACKQPGHSILYTAKSRKGNRLSDVLDLDGLSSGNEFRFDLHGYE